jgi:hypothetical protein
MRHGTARGGPNATRRRGAIDARGSGRKNASECSDLAARPFSRATTVEFTLFARIAKGDSARHADVVFGMALLLREFDFRVESRATAHPFSWLPAIHIVG